MSARLQLQRTPLSGGLRRTWRTAYRRLGVPGLLGISALILALALLTLWLPSLRQDLALNERAMLFVKQPRGEVGQDVAAQPVADPARIAVQSEEAQLAAVLQDLLETARTERIELKQGRYVWNAAARDRFATYELQLPIRADYPALRRFIATALDRHPRLALAALSLRRGGAEVGPTQTAAPAGAAPAVAASATDPDTQAVQAQLRFVLYVLDAQEQRTLAAAPGQASVAAAAISTSVKDGAGRTP
jgi:hypothetical protein